ncbi:hypothetical protein [Arcobacter sp. YIC-310]|uniref:hypothetical protein n=1 Tax=Arcobacter sp. YIC-310 TaxID=3376632 RepID=UPI003C1315E1
MNLNTKIQWFYALIAMIPLSIAIFQILDYSTFKALGITSLLILVCFSMFFFLRRNYYFSYKTIIYFYFIGFVGAFLVAYFKQDWLLLPMVLAFWISLLKTISYTSVGKINSLKIYKEEQDSSFFKKFFISNTRRTQNKLILIDILITIIFFFSVIIIYTSLANIFK